MNASSSSNDDESQEELQNEIAELEDRLRKAKQRLLESKAPPPPPPLSPSASSPLHRHRHQLQIPHSLPHNPHQQQQQQQHHNLLLLSDSALPLGSFAFSSGFESYRAHARASRSTPRSFEVGFLPLSVASFAATSLPFMLAGYRDPGSLASGVLDDACDAATICAVARRASVAQGRALLGVWEKSFVGAVGAGGCGGGVGVTDGRGDGEQDYNDPVRALKQFAALVRLSSSNSSAAAARRRGAAAAAAAADLRRDNDEDEDEDEDEDDIPHPQAASAHFAPLFGVVARALGIPAPQAAYVFVLGHVRALTSAAMRAGVFGPFQAQRILAGDRARGLVAAAIAREWDTPFERAGQTAPALDLWAGRHEVLYSKIFNS
ncbi:hypothetical protein MGN70_002358 [Eutypa lata]|nr:hypothetical protein MGN70_002358 [Eutypa lata]